MWYVVGDLTSSKGLPKIPSWPEYDLRVLLARKFPPVLLAKKLAHVEAVASCPSQRDLVQKEKRPTLKRIGRFRRDQSMTLG
jgi:hypothetical protein